VKTTDFIIIAIDGGAAAGKSSTAAALSERFHLLHVDTGSFYRAVTAELLRRGVRHDALAAVCSALAGMTLGTRITGRRAEDRHALPRKCPRSLPRQRFDRLGTQEAMGIRDDADSHVAWCVFRSAAVRR